MVAAGMNQRPRYAAVYPTNHVMETEGGHIREYDDTIGAREYMNAMRQAQAMRYDPMAEGHKSQEGQL